MNKTRFIGIAALAALAATLLVVVLREKTAPPQAPSLLPAETIAFFYMPDASGSAHRWSGTALHDIASEPEVKAFLDSTLSQVPNFQLVRQKLAEIAALRPREVFLAVTALEGSEPSLVAGLELSGDPEAAEALIAQGREELRKLWPAGSADLVPYDEETAIETFTSGPRTFASARRGDWYLLANSLPLLRQTLDRLDGTAETPSLAGQQRLSTSLSQLPGDFDTLLFVQPGILLERLTGLLGSAGLSGQQAQIEQLRKIEAYSAVAKFEGQNVRDATFTLGVFDTQRKPMELGGLRFTTAGTALFYAKALHGSPTGVSLPDPSLDRFGVLRALESMRAALAAKGIDAATLAGTFGPEISLIVDWPAETGQPSLLASLDVRDRGKALEVLKTLAASASFGGAFAHQEVERLDLFVLPAVAFGLSPTFALGDRYLLGSLTTEAVQRAFASADGQGLRATGTYAAATGSLQKPTAAFGYLDAQKLFVHVYGMLRPFLVMGAALTPEGTSHIDLSKLPSAGTISRHLGPVAVSQTATEDGVLVESVGPVTFTQTILGSALVAGAVAAPMIAEQLKGGMSGALQGLSPQPMPTPAPGSPLPPQATPATPSTPEPAVPPAASPESPAPGKPPMAE